MSANAKFLPLALRLELPFDGASLSNAFGEITASPYGALWSSLSDPVEGNALITSFGAGSLPTNALSGRYLATLSPMYALDSLGTGNFVRLRAFALGQTLTPAQATDGILQTNAALMTFNSAGTSSQALISADTALDGVAESNSNWLRTIGAAYLSNGASFDRAGSASAVNLAEQSGNRAALATAPGEWTLNSEPAVNTTATATRAAGAAGVRHVLRSINATLVGVAAIAAPISVVVRDGASGAGAILWSDKLFAPAAGSRDRITIIGLNIIGSAATAMTVEFTAAPGATNFEVLSATGYSSAAQAA